MTSGQHNTNRALLATCVAAAARAAEIIRQRSGERQTLTWENKGPADFVSAVDRAAEQAIGDMVASRHTDATLLGEEFSPTADTQRGLVFVADPLDGTTNFLHGFPWYAVSIGAMIDGELAAGAILNVPNGELFSATAGGGARLNGQPISVSPITEPMHALIGTGMPFRSRDGVDEYLQMLKRVIGETAGIRRPGSAALDLADVASGRFEAFWELRLAPWDIAAGLLLVREAGGVVTDLDGEPCQVKHTSLLAGSPFMHAWMFERVGRQASS